MLIRSTASAPRALGMLLLCVLASVAGAGAAEAAPKKLKVFILAGQSNMEGPASVTTFDYIGDDPATAPLLKMMRGSDGKPTVCDGVWISYLTGAGADNFTLNGKLTAGYGSMWGQDRTTPGTNIGPEFTFGLTMDAAFEEPVLLIKTAWGGKSLNTDFRPPSAGPYVLPKETQDVWDHHPQGAHGIPKAEDRPKIAAEKVAATGVYYRLMIEHVKKVLADPNQVMPDYDPAQGYEIAGFAWLQGWNDAVDSQTYPRRHQPDGYAMYSELLADFIRDVRKDLGAPKMPFVIGVMGVGGLRDPSPATVAFRTAMAAPADMPEFKGNVTAVQTAPFWPDELTDIEAKRVRVGQMRQALDSKHKDHANADGTMTDEQKSDFVKKFEADLISPAEAAAWKRGVSNAGYHYLGCAKIFALMGKHFAEANLALLEVGHDSPATSDKTASTTDKTLVAWVAPANLVQQGGSVLTIQEDTRFDAIVLGERSRGTWMAGSDGFSRTQKNQDANATETAGPHALVQLAIVYQGDTVRLYRNGEAYAEYTAQNIDLLHADDHIAVFGLRHLGAGSGTPFAGAIEDARIYSRALSAQEIRSLKPDAASDILPLAWWDFEGEAPKDRASHFVHYKTENGATIKDGRLVLDGKGSEGWVGQWHFGKRRPSWADHEEQHPEPTGGMRPDRGGAEVLPVNAQGRIFLLGAGRP